LAGASKEATLHAGSRKALATRFFAFFRDVQFQRVLVARAPRNAIVDKGNSVRICASFFVCFALP
jgi:hypothetical protein